MTEKTEAVAPVSHQLGIDLATTLEERIAARKDPAPQEVENVVRLSPEERYDFFVTRVVEKEEIWAAFDEQGILSYEADSRTLVPFWPQRRFAEFGPIDPSTDKLVPIPLDDWINVILCSDMARANADPAIFPVKGGRSLVCNTEDLLFDVANMWQRYFKAHGTNDEDLEEIIQRLMRRSMEAKPKGKLP